MFEKQQPDGLKSRWSYRGWAPSADGFVVKNHGDCNSFPFQITCKWYKWPKNWGWSGLHLQVRGAHPPSISLKCDPQTPWKPRPGSALGDPSWILKKWSTSKSRAPYHPYLHEWFGFFNGKLSIPWESHESVMNPSWDIQGTVNHGIVSFQEDRASTLEEE